VPHLPITLIVALAENRVIGAKGQLPWRLPDDLRRFKRLTLGKPCIMGRKTWESLPVKPLPGRTNVVVTRDPDFNAPGAVTATSFQGALETAAIERPREIMVIGGEAIFAAALPLASRIELTEVGSAPEGDAFMPEFDAGQWREAAREGPFEAGGLRYSFVTLERLPGG
jgi:dihydrofolate reductase